MNRADFELDFRPASYWDTPDALAAILQNVQGQTRRDMIRDFLTGLTPDELSEIDPALLESELDDGSRGRLGAIHPMFMGGEYLPAFKRGQVEIARIVLASTTQDVFSIRVRRRPSGVYAYSFHDEYQSTWHIRPRTSKQPLTMGRLIQLIDTATCDEMPVGQGDLIIDLYQGAGGLPHGVGFVRVESEVYPELGAWYRMREDAEVARLQAEE
jgi:hypothetical protein